MKQLRAGEGKEECRRKNAETKQVFTSVFCLLHSWDITAQREAGQGSVFIVTLRAELRGTDK